MQKFLKTTLAAVLVTASAGAAMALPPLEDDPRVVREFFAAAVGDEIRNNCPSISARMLRVVVRAKELESYALKLGYSQDDITQMRKSPEAKAKLEAMRDNYLAKNGVTPGDAASYCRLGMAEIEKNTLTGYLLRAN
ncbi:DUF5333 domain-containing protein [Psychromarinibacter sp. S121]|uniref:DUF5333 domain-containing protein n=1 Tax=Psychromarinibacter sp. S121 TaxID=3415127 RepID=UPI003C7B2E6E